MWMALANNSLPVPVSPKSITGEGVCEAMRAARMASLNTGSCPMMDSKVMALSLNRDRWSGRGMAAMVFASML